jgi:tripartite ATP-independent transporter DctP family solute receptor
VKLFPGGTLGGDVQTVSALQGGTIEMTVLNAGILSNQVKEFAIFDFPFLFGSAQEADAVTDGAFGKNLFAKLGEKNLVGLGYWDLGFRNLTNSKRPINAPEDVRGLKVRVPPVAELEATMEALGAEVSKVGFKELPLALAQGVVDGQENPINVIYYNKLYEVQKHLALTRHVYYNTLHLMSAKSWARLTPAQQAIVREESKAAGDGMRKKIIGEEDELIAKMAAAGVKVTRPDPAPFRAATQGARAQIARFAGDENVRMFLKMVDAERKQ